MAGETRGGLGVSQFGVAKDFAANGGQARVVLDQLRSQMDMVVVVVVDAVVVEPRLHALREILVMVDARILAFPQAGLHRGGVGGLQSRVEARVHIQQAAQMDVVRELVDEDALLLIRVAGKSQHVFLGHRAQGIGLAAAESAGAGVPEILRRQTGEITEPAPGHADELGQVGGEFIVGHDAHACAALDHRRAHVGSFRQHHVDEENGLLERVRIHLRGGDDGEALGPGALGVEGRNAVSAAGVEAESLDRHLAGDRGGGLVGAADDFEAMPEGGVDDGVVSRFDGSAGHPLGIVFQPEEVDGSAAAVDDLQLRANGMSRLAGCVAGGHRRGRKDHPRGEEKAPEVHGGGGAFCVRFRRRIRGAGRLDGGDQRPDAMLASGLARAG